jgi:hypothetical protein
MPTPDLRAIPSGQHSPAGIHPIDRRAGAAPSDALKPKGGQMPPQQPEPSSSQKPVCTRQSFAPVCRLSVTSDISCHPGRREQVHVPFRRCGRAFPETELAGRSVENDPSFPQTDDAVSDRYARELIWCSEHRNGCALLLWRIWRSKPMTSCAVCGSRLATGSSARMSFGSLIRARAMPTRCFCPPDKRIHRPVHMTGFKPDVRKSKQARAATDSG